jgi:CubicO group peptidase (beta-lactamase class C family)
MNLVTRSVAMLTAITVAVAGAAARVDAEPAMPWPTDGWPTSTPEAQGMDSALLAEGIRFLDAQQVGIPHSATIIRNGHIVADAYFHPFTEGSLHPLASATKSFMATVVGIAIDRGFIEAVDQSVFDWFGDRAVADLDADKEAMTIGDLLTMSAGFECFDEPHGPLLLQQMHDSPDWAQFVLDRPMTAPPGTRFAYCSPVSHLLSAIVTQATDTSTSDFARAHLFEPMGITEFNWPTDPQGIDWGHGFLVLSPHDMAKLGYLYLQDGVWDGERLVPSEWIDAATSPGVVDYYGYQWWVEPDGYCAIGWGGQVTCVYPDDELIVAMTGGESSMTTVSRMFIEQFVRPAVISSTPLPHDPVGEASLASATRAATTPTTHEACQPPLPPATAGTVSGKRYAFESHPYLWRAATFAFEDPLEATLDLTFFDGSEGQWVIGLDGFPRQGTDMLGLPVYASGVWESDDVFVVRFDSGWLVGGELRTTFENDQVFVRMWDDVLAGEAWGRWDDGQSAPEVDEE